MQFTFANSATNMVRSYEPGRLSVNGKTLVDNVLLTGQSVESWDVGSISDLSASDFDPIIAHRPEVVLVGTGERQVMFSPRIYSELSNAGIGVEIMATSAAVRTFNVLLSEDRRVLAALIV